MRRLTLHGRDRATQPPRRPRGLATLGLAAILLLAVGGVARIEVAHAEVDAETLAARHGFAPADVGYLLFDTSDGRVLEQHGADRTFIPASTTKVTTALAALEILGADFRFVTTVLATGDVRDGVLDGDLYLRGGGDPSLSTEDLRALVAQAKGAGIRRVAGAFHFDESLYPRRGEIDLLQPAAATYNPAVSALAVNYNRIELRWKRDAKARRPSVTIVSPADGGAVPLQGIGSGTLDAGLDPRIELVFSPGTPPRWLLSPRLAERGSTFLPVKDDPGPVVAELFATVAEKAGVVLPLPTRGAVPADARVIASHQSDPLTEIASGLLRYSNNLTAELTGLAASRHLAGEGLQLEDSARRLAAWWQDHLPDTSFRGFVAANHSGLSSVTRHSPRQLAAILRYGQAAPLSGVRLRELMPARELAEDGAPRERSPRDGPPVRAKSGTLLYADGLVGFLDTRRGRELGFVILLTDDAARARLDASRDTRISVSPPEATDWTGRAKALERDLIARWSEDG